MTADENWDYPRTKYKVKSLKRVLSENNDTVEFAFYLISEKCREFRSVDYPAEMNVQYPLGFHLKKEFVVNFLYNEWEIPHNKFKDIIVFLKEALSSSFIGKEQFSWLDSSQPEMCYWAWSYLQINLIATRFSPSSFRPSCPEECLIAVKEEILRDFKSSSLEKIQFIEQMKATWSDVLTYHSRTEWLSLKSIERYNDAWRYLCDREYEPRHFQPMKQEDIYYCVFATLFTWDLKQKNTRPVYGKKEEQNLSQQQLIERIDKAWKQKEFRKQQAEKLVNIKVKREIYDKLKALAKAKGKPLKKILEELALSEEQPLVG